MEEEEEFESSVSSVDSNEQDRAAKQKHFLHCLSGKLTLCFAIIVV